MTQEIKDIDIRTDDDNTAVEEYDTQPVDLPIEYTPEQYYQLPEEVRKAEYKRLLKVWGKMGGRPTKYNEELVSRICLDIENGLPPSRAAEKQGITHASINHWKSGKAGFLQAIKRAFAIYEAKHLKRIDASGNKLDYGSCWLLERRDSDNFSPVKRSEIKDWREGTLPAQREDRFVFQLVAKTVEARKVEAKEILEGEYTIEDEGTSENPEHTA